VPTCNFRDVSTCWQVDPPVSYLVCRLGKRLGLASWANPLGPTLHPTQGVAVETEVDPRVLQMNFCSATTVKKPHSLLSI
jgi:hypothetical protein